MLMPFLHCLPGGPPGTHKHRFDDQGRGKGLFGRDSIPKGRDYTSPNALEIYRRAEYQTF